MNCIILAEDITIAVQQQRDFETPGGVSPLAECMFMGQKYGLGVILVCHGLSGLGPLIVRNTEAWIVTRAQGEDPRVIGNVLGVTPEHVARMRILRPGEFVIFNPVLWPKPVYATFPPPVIPGICDDSMQRALVEKFLARVTTRPPASLEVFRPQAAGSTASQGMDASPQQPTEAQIRALVIIASGSPQTAGKVYERMGLSRTQSRRIIKALEGAGALSAHRFSTGRIGGQICFFEVCEPGWAILRPRGLSEPAPLTKGGFEHELAAQLLKAEASRNDLGIQFEVDLGGLRVDAALKNHKTGQRICCQIGISRPDHEVDSIQRFFTLPVAKEAKFVLIARDTAFAKQVKKIFKTRQVAEAVVRRVHMRLIADLVKE